MNLQNKTIDNQGTIFDGSTITFDTLTPNEPVLSNNSQMLVSGQINLSSPNFVSSVLPISFGGTNSSTSLANNKLMVSNAGKIIEGTSSTNPSFTGVNISSLSVSQPVLTDASKNLTSGQISLASNVTNVLPVSNGGTNSGTSLANNKLMISNAGQIVEGTSSSTPAFSNVNLSALTASQPVLTDASKNLTSGQINLTSNVTGILPVANGGNNSSTALTNNKLMVSSGGAIIEGTSSSTPAFSNVNLSALTASQPVLTDSSKNLSSGQINLTSNVTGILPIANGGTNSNTALTNGNIIVSSAGKLIEGTSSSNPTFSNVTLTSLAPVLPVLTNSSNTLVSGQISLANSVTNVLPIANGGTNSSTALTNGNIIVSSAGKLIEGTSSATPSFTGITVSGLTASQPVVTNASKGLASGQINLASSSFVSGILPIANGGTNSSSALANGNLMISSGGQIIEGTSSSNPSFSGITLTGLAVGLSSALVGLNGSTQAILTGITGTANQVNVTNSSGNINLSLPQSINTTSSVSFSTIALSTQPVFIGEWSAVQSLLNNTATLINTTMVTIKNNAGISYAAGVFTLSAAGLYSICIEGVFAGNATGNRIIYATYSGDTRQYGYYSSVPNGAAVEWCGNSSFMVSTSGSSTISIYAQQTSGASLNFGSATSTRYPRVYMYRLA